VENYIKQIEQILRKSKWSQEAFAKELGVTFATVNRWINGHSKPHPGQLRQIDKFFKAIIGIEPLPAEKIADIFGKIKNKKIRFKNIKKILVNEKIVEDFLLELTYNSDAIEGSTLTKKETEAVIFDKAVIKNKKLIEHLEASNHAVVLRDIFSAKFSQTIDESLIKSLHKALMQGIREDAGQYAKYQRGIRGVDLVLPHPQDIPEEMKEFCSKVNQVKGHPIEHFARMHADFESIHPFGDGNGRVGRLIMVIQMIESGFAPCLINVEQKAKYYECLEYAQKKSSTHLAYFLAETVLKGYEIIAKYNK